MTVTWIRRIPVLLAGLGTWSALALGGYAADYSEALMSAAADPVTHQNSEPAESPQPPSELSPASATQGEAVEYADVAVNVEPAVEHEHLVPQSVLQSPDASHARAQQMRHGRSVAGAAPRQTARSGSTSTTVYRQASLPTYNPAARPAQRMAMTVPSTKKPNYYLPTSRVVRQADVPTEAAPESVSAGPSATVEGFPTGPVYSSGPVQEYMPFEPTWNGSMTDMSRGVFFGGAEFLLIRPTFSENVAYLTNTVSQDSQGNAFLNDEIVNQDFGYNGSVRAFVGYRLPDCCGELRFTYWNYGNSSSLLSPEATATTTYVGHLEVLTRIPGERLGVDSSLNVNVYDIDYGKCICYNGCCDPCNYCPPWGIKYYAGVRIADVQRQDNTDLFGINGNVAQLSEISADFIGAGPRVGLEGRRWFRGGRGSLFARSNLALLLGQYDVEMQRVTFGTVDITETYHDSHARIIPVAEIELGGNYQLTNRVNLALGYLFQAWWDLGAFEQIEGNVFRSPIDDANIMSFDGFFTRVEICF